MRSGLGEGELADCCTALHVATGLAGVPGNSDTLPLILLFATTLRFLLSSRAQQMRVTGSRR